MLARIPACHKVRAACDVCHKAKARCSKGSPCKSCARSGRTCRYSISNRLGRPPKGVSNDRRANLNGDDMESAIYRQQPFGENFPISDGSLIDASPTSSHAASSLEADFAKLEDPNYMFRGFYSIGNNQQPWIMDPDQLHQFPPREVETESPPQTGPEPRWTSEDPAKGRFVGVTQCSCLHQHTLLLNHLKALDWSNHPGSIAVTLDAAHQSLRLWQGHLACESCWGNGNSGTMLLLMGIDIIVKRLRQFIVYQQQQYECTGNLPRANSPRTPGKAVAKAAAAVIAEESVVGTHTPDHGGKLRYDSETSPMNIAIGEFQVPEEERMFVVGMLVIRVLTRIKDGLEDLRGRIGMGEGRDENDAYRHQHQPFSKLVPFTLNTLGKSVLELEQSLMDFITG
ncbi:hypothetical protein F5Y04DRAFT_171652 [Hypomontagnella monticulosa]|nr:hypothetical protein F5Y04DRAFT_171652 [Hypomontagnella monticulosa]